MADRFVYVIGCHSGPNKIGVANDVERRLGAIQSGNEKKLAVIRKFAVAEELAHKIERRAHWHVRESQLLGEWFSITADEAIAAVELSIGERGEGPHIPTRPGGRPPLCAEGTIKTTLRISKPMLDEMQELVGSNRVAEFIRTAVLNHLDEVEPPSSAPPSSAN